MLLATDGLTKMVRDEEVAGAIAEDPTPQRVVERLIERARAAGGADNVTVVAARVPPTTAKRGLKGWFARLSGG